MIVAFDLDDTLYRELDYVESGFRAVAAELEREFHIPEDITVARMDESLARFGRGRQFDDALRAAGLFTVRRRNRLVQVYRRHRPALDLPATSSRVLDELRQSGHTLYLVTDGNAAVQSAKIDALGLRDRFVHCYCTSRYGLASAKPATRVFELMLARSRARPDQLVYIGDNPRKDFVGVRALGGRAVRVLAGAYASESAQDGYAADVEVKDISEVVGVVAAWAR